MFSTFQIYLIFFLGCLLGAFFGVIVTIWCYLDRLLITEPSDNWRRIFKDEIEKVEKNYDLKLGVKEKEK